MCFCEKIENFESFANFVVFVGDFLEKFFGYVENLGEYRMGKAGWGSLVGMVLGIFGRRWVLVVKGFGRLLGDS